MLGHSSRSRKGAALVFPDQAGRAEKDRKRFLKVFERYAPARIYLGVVNIVLVRRCVFVVLTVCLVLGQRAALQGAALVFSGYG